MPVSSFAYLFERFPSFTQTFCVREVAEMFRQRMDPLVVSIRSDQEAVPTNFDAGKVEYLPASAELESAAKRLKEEHRLPRRISRILGRWGEAGDKMRAYEAMELGPRLRARGITHIHAHFAGMAARTACWIRRFYGIPFSFTGHANDIFCESDFPITLNDLVREALFVVTETDFSRDWLKGKIPEGKGKIFRVFNGIEIAPSQSSGGAVPISARKPRLLSVGRLIEKKGFPVLIEACRILNEQGVECETRIVGDGPLEETLRARIAAAGLEDRVILAGSKSQEEIGRMLAESVVFALPCVHEKQGGMDNLPTVIMEAMSAGLPVISTRVAGIPEMVLDGRTGSLIPEHDPAALAEAIRRLLQERALAERFGETGRALAVEKFSIQVTTRELKHLLVNPGRARAGREACELDPLLKEKSRFSLHEMLSWRPF